jgi:hypothetical protein
MYLESPLESVDNVVAWWGVSYYILFFSRISSHLAYVATFHPISNTVSHGPRLSHHPRLLHSIRVNFLQWQFDRHLPLQLFKSSHL